MRTLIALFTLPLLASAAELLPGNRMLDAYLADETAHVAQQAFAEIATLEDWQRERPRYREELLEMLGLSPLPERTDLQATVTGTIDQPDFTVEKLHFQSLPGLYVTANLYVPKNLTGKAPAILYVCGHSRQVADGVSFGNKAGYHHHGVWFARHGYVCLMIDTIQLGELQGVHHGTRNQGLWWWNARGYTPAGVEAWNSMRALDYLESRPEVDATRIGMTGRSGGGAYTWFTATLDERVKVAVPVAGITDLHTHVVDGRVVGHCDCMFHVNTYRWDFAKLAALMAPRPLLLANSDKDPIFPLEGVLRVHRDLARIYRLHGAADKLGLLITEGPHRDTQDLQVPAFRWFNRFLKEDESAISVPAERIFDRADLKVFATPPADERTTRIHDTFVPAATPALPPTASAWQAQTAAWRDALEKKVFAGWPAAPMPLALARATQVTEGNLALSTWEFSPQRTVRLPLYVFASPAATAPRPGRLHVLDEQAWLALLATVPSAHRAALAAPLPVPDNLPAPSSELRALLDQAARGELTVAFLPPRGIGPTRWSGTEAALANQRRRFMLLGQTLDGMRVWDIRRGLAAAADSRVDAKVTAWTLSGERHQAVNALYASLFTDGLAGLHLAAPPASHHTGPDYLNVLRFLDIPQATAWAAERQPVTLTETREADWTWTTATARTLGWPQDRLRW